MVSTQHPVIRLKSLRRPPKLAKITRISIKVLLVLVAGLVCLIGSQWRHLGCLTPSTHAATDASVDVLIMMIVQEWVVVFSIKHHHVGTLAAIIILYEVIDVVILNQVAVVIKCIL